MKLFKDADPTRRTPVYLQSHTKENMIWQFKLLGVFLVVMTAWDRYNEYKDRKALENLNKNPLDID
jgi:hypothetical protein